MENGINPNGIVTVLHFEIDLESVKKRSIGAIVRNVLSSMVKLTISVNDIALISHQP